MVVSAVDVFCRLTQDCQAINKEEIPNVNEKKTQKRRSKSVHFADSKGLALTSTFLFARENLSPPASRRTRIKDNKRGRKPGQAAQLLNITSNVSYEELLKKVNRTNVCLENIVCYAFGLYGRIRVKNIAYEKCVSVRYTFNAWQSFEEEVAKYIPGASTEDADSFFFHIRPPKTTADRKMEFAIRYRVCGSEYWDNNFGDNYRLVYFKTKSVETLNLPLLNDPPERNI